MQVLQHNQHDPAIANDPVAKLLVQAPPPLRAAAWQAYEDARDEDDLAQRIGAMLLPKAVKAQLWDMKYAAGQQRSAQSGSTGEYLSTDPNAGRSTQGGARGRGAGPGPGRPGAALAPPGGYLSTDPNAGEPVKTSARAAATGQESGGVAGFAREFWNQVNPISLVKSISQTVAHPIETGKMVLGAQGALLDKAKASADSGDYVTATRHFINYLLPIVGPGVDAAADLMSEGRFAEGLGASAGMGVALSAGPAAKNLRLRVPAVARNPNPVEADAVAAAMREGIPVDAGTASGNRFVRGVQRIADESLGGSSVAGRANQRQADAMTRAGERIADRVHPAPVTAEQAGQSARLAVEGVITRLAKEADDAYARLRDFETQAPSQTRSPHPGAQFQSMRLAVDTRGTKAAMEAIYRQLQREKELVGSLHGSKARALVTLDALMDAPDFAPLSVADRALGELKAMARGADLPALRTQGQGIAARAVRELEAAVTKTALDAGPQVYGALRAGRQATRSKYAAAEILEQLADEPVRTTNRLTAVKDSSAALLRDVADVAPAELPKIGRAVLEGLFEKATAEGGFGRGAGIFADWQRLGSTTKDMLYGPHLKDLDNFFLFAKKMGESPNPSGTALTLAKGGELGLFVTNPLLGGSVSLSAMALSKLLRNPRAVQLLTRGLVIPVKAKGAVAVFLSQLTQLARESGVTLTPARSWAQDEAGRERR